MGDSRTVNTTRNLFWGIIAKIVEIIMPFISRTAMIYVLGMRYVGLNSLFTSILGVLSLAELGFGSALVFSMYKPMAENDVKTVNALLAFYKKCYRIIGLVIFVLGICMLPFLNVLVKEDVPDDVNMQLLFCIQLFDTVIGYFTFAYKGSIFQAQQRIDIRQKISLMLNVTFSIIRTVLLIICQNYYAYVLLGPVSAVLQNMLVAYYAKKLYPEYRCKGVISTKEKGEIRNKVAGLVVQKIGGIVLSSVDTIVISAFLGLRILGIYNGYYYVVTALVGFIGVIQNALIPSLGNSIVSESKEKNYQDFQKFHFLIIWLLTWWSACLLCLFQPFIELWQGEENMLSFGMVILFCLYFYLHHAGDITYMYKEAAGIWWEGRYYSLVAAGVNLVLNIVLVQMIGLPGILISTIVALVTVHIPYGSWILFKQYFESKKKYFSYMGRMLLYFAVAMIVSLVTYVACMAIPIRNLWLQLLVRGGICAVLPNVVFSALYWRTMDFQKSVRYLIGILIGTRRKA